MRVGAPRRMEDCRETRSSDRIARSPSCVGVDVNVDVRVDGRAYDNHLAAKSGRLYTYDETFSSTTTSTSMTTSTTVQMEFREAKLAIRQFATRWNT